MPQYKLLHGKMHPPRKGPGADGKTAVAGDIVSMTEARAARYADMLERVVPAAPKAPKADDSGAGGKGAAPSKESKD